MSTEFALSRLHQSKPIAMALHLRVVPGCFASVDDAAMAVGLKPIGTSWEEVDRSNAEIVLATILGEYMSFNLPRLDASMVALSIREFLDACPADGRFFTNGDWGRGTNRGWMPATEATFDGGILALGATAAGVFWLEDED
ncbi:hypothetical protein DES53_108153 [Roseimicrobium gellanilyticum]|uniref:Uncharacterized protein n=1 Tax=Roseimicrobium gellanilyticum TaxID=748857 RepID=A0A366HDF7_9BACT|nr:hypothetical protein [Roseimicrobium gellanilyticum]RBP40446.1 hypothetical protein DES53_108153 [Roseimicrobium gellanilyticum]